MAFSHERYTSLEMFCANCAEQVIAKIRINLQNKDVLELIYFVERQLQRC